MSILSKSNLQKVTSIPKKLYQGLESLNNTLEVAPRIFGSLPERMLRAFKDDDPQA